MIWLYRILFLPLLLLALPYYGWRMFRRGGYRHDFHHRLGLIDRPPPKRAGVCRVWIQAVSVGEIKAVGPLIAALGERGDVEVVLTTTTSTGYQLARELYARSVLKVGVFPVDFVAFSRNAWRRLDPDVAVLMESELWPEHLYQARRRGRPVVLINARLSDRSFERYRKYPRIAARLVSEPARILASSDQDARRFQELGACPGSVVDTGSIKFDVSIDPILSLRERDALKREMGLESQMKETRSPLRPPLVLLGSSTWPGEEQFLIETLEQALQEGVNCRLLLVPRHAERRNELASLLKSQGRRWHVRSSGKTPEHPVRLYLGDTTGELALLSQVADLAFIGKSLPPNAGGQTPIEAAALGLPMVYGPNMSNFSQICRSLESCGASRRAEDAASARRWLLDLLKNGHLRQEMAEAAHEWHLRNRGAARRTLAELEHFFPHA